MRRLLVGLILGVLVMAFFDPGGGGPAFLSRSPRAAFDPGFVQEPAWPGLGAYLPLPAPVYDPNVYGAPSALQSIRGFDPGAVDAPQAGPPQPGVVPGAPPPPPPPPPSTFTAPPSPVVTPPPPVVEPPTVDELPFEPPTRPPRRVERPDLPPVVTLPPPPPPTIPEVGVVGPGGRGPLPTIPPPPAPLPPAPPPLSGLPPVAPRSVAGPSPLGGRPSFGGGFAARAPFSLSGGRPAFLPAFRGLQRSPFGQAAQVAGQPLAPPPFGRFGGFGTPFPFDEERRRFQGGAGDTGPAFLSETF